MRTSGRCTKTISTSIRTPPMTRGASEADGTPSPAWYNPGAGRASAKITNQAGYARQNSPEIVQLRRATRRAYLRAAVASVGPRGGSAAGRDGVTKVSATASCSSSCHAHGGPLFGEKLTTSTGPAGATESARSAAARPRAASTSTSKIPSADGQPRHGLLRTLVPPRLRPSLGPDTGSMEQIDKYRAQGSLTAMPAVGALGRQSPWVIRDTT